MLFYIGFLYRDAIFGPKLKLISTESYKSGTSHTWCQSTLYVTKSDIHVLVFPIHHKCSCITPNKCVLFFLQFNFLIVTWNKSCQCYCPVLTKERMSTFLISSFCITVLSVPHIFLGCSGIWTGAQTKRKLSTSWAIQYRLYYMILFPVYLSKSRLFLQGLFLYGSLHQH